MQRDESNYHRCPFPGCTQRVPRHLWGCKAHWYRVPHDLRDRLWRAYRGDDLAEHAAALEAIDRYFAGSEARG